MPSRNSCLAYDQLVGALAQASPEAMGGTAENTYRIDRIEHSSWYTVEWLWMERLFVQSHGIDMN